MRCTMPCSGYRPLSPLSPECEHRRAPCFSPPGLHVRRECGRAAVASVTAAPVLAAGTHPGVNA
eukprot:scaffold345_cov104-Isochrysis_galbana.AAC.11